MTVAAPVTPGGGRMQNPALVGVQARRSMWAAAGYEAVPWSFYNWVTYAAAGQQVLTFFQQGVGSGGLTLDDTNFRGQGGAFPAGQKFEIETVQVAFRPGENPSTGPLADAPQNFINDTWAALRGGALVLQISTKTYIEDGPLFRFPCDCRFAGFAAVDSQLTIGAATQSWVGYMSSAGTPYRMDYQPLDENVNFSFSMQWQSGAIALPSTVAGKIAVIMRGTWYRRPQ